jgi:enoyl-CoA hydratase
MVDIDSPTEGVTRLTMNLPPVNALDTAAIIALTGAFKAIAADPPAQGLLLTGAGKAFCAGVDVRAFAALDHAGRLALARAITAMVAALVAIPCPVIALVNGHALGGGLILALGADWRIAVDHPAIKLGLLEAQAGVPFPAGPMAMLHHLLPGTLARRLALSSEALPPAAMHGHGIVDELCAADELTASGVARAKALASQPGFALVKKQTLAPLTRELTALAAQGDEPYWEMLG